MKFLFCVFLALFWYGIVFGHTGPAMLSFVMALLMYYADKRFAAQDAAHNAAMDKADKTRNMQQ